MRRGANLAKSLKEMVGTTGAPQMSNINRLHQGAGIFGTLKPKGYF
jgi:hypothetical protein